MDELSKLQITFTDYKTALKNRDKAENDYQDLKRAEPRQPQVILDQTQFDDYAKALTDWHKRMADAQILLKHWEQTTAQLSRQLAKDVPLEHTLFRVSYDGQDYGICTYLEVWGGVHTDWKISPWSDDLKPESDHTHYD